MDYKDTLNLPSTTFPMKANLPKKEPAMLTYWEEISLYERLQAIKSDKRFVLHDGPPYANGHIHLGHTVNKILKDIIVKCAVMSGQKSPYVPGWDCHGLPIEHNVEKELGKKKADMGQIEIRERCRDYARRFINIQMEEFRRLGVVADWKRPYLTMSNDYEASIADMFCKIYLLGIIEKRKKPVYWCPSCITALAEAEVEYGDHKSPSIYVKFNASYSLQERLQEIASASLQRLSVVIWTTTPWTLPSNLAIALHPDYDYVIIRHNGEDWLIAEERLMPFLIDVGIEQGAIEIIARLKGADIEGLYAHHPFLDRDSLLVTAEYVTLDAGTGCVHIAPGHGEDDYLVALRHGLKIYCPVDKNGRFQKGINDEGIDFLEGIRIFDANKVIIEVMEGNGSLIASSLLTHSYPHCWRCKRPVIFRATSQWFISMDKDRLRERALEAIDKVKWIPHWGKDRIRGMVDSRPDWCISRQRAWGVPITVFLCSKCGTPYLDKESAKKIVDAFREEGADAWFNRDVSQLISSSASCKNCGNADFKKETDILDVWFDSGVSHRAVLSQREGLSFPADLYLEGSDQHRGWFQSSLLTSVAVYNEPPYKSALTHGFVVDGKGKKMSKSVGNVIAPEKVIKRYGAEVLRLWVSAEDYRDDIKISEEILKRLSEAYRKIRNTIRYLLGNLSDFSINAHLIALNALYPIDKWAVARLDDLIKKVKAAYEEYRFHIVFHSIYQFCTVDMSSLYLDIIKDRLYCELKDGMKRRSAQTALFIIAHDLLRLIAPILSFTAEEAWRCYDEFEAVSKRVKEKGSIFFSQFPKGGYKDSIGEKDDFYELWDRLFNVRSEITKALEIARNERLIGLALDAKVIVTASDKELLNFLRDNQGLLKELSIVSQLECHSSPTAIKDEDTALISYESEEIKGLFIGVKKASGQKCKRCWQWNEDITGEDERFGSVCPRCKGVLNLNED